MLPEHYSDRISTDWLWREKDFRAINANLVETKKKPIFVKSAILIMYSHWEGHFKFAASELLTFIVDGINRKLFKWTDIKPEIRQRILFCSYRKSSISGQTQEKFVSYLNALHDSRFADALKAKDEIIMVDDNLNSMRAEAICRNLGVEYSWFATKKILIDERLLEHRNAIAHGSIRLRTGDIIDFSHRDHIDSINEVQNLIREAKNRFENTIIIRSFLA